MAHKNKKYVVGRLDCFSNGITITSEVSIKNLKDDLRDNLPEIYKLDGKLVRITIEEVR